MTFGPVLRLDGDLDVVSADIFEDIFEFNAGTASVAGSFVPAPVQVAPSGMVSINGNVRQGAVLTADTSALSDANGMGALSYQWQRDGADIAEATEMEYIPIQSDVDAVMTVVVSYIDGLGMAEGVTSSQTAAVANVNDLPTGTVTISGNVENVIVDQVLTATVEGLTDPDGLGTLSYQWLNGDVEIATSGGVLEITNPDGSTTLITDRAFNAEEAGFLTGETASTYTVREEDQGKNISVRVSYTDGYGSNDYLDGTREDVVLYSITGNGVANVLVGTERDEYIQGLGGNDMISGVGGADVLSGSIGEDYIFGDAFELRYALTEANQVFRLYQATFAREPDEAGHKGWATRLFTGEQSLAQVTQGFVKSQEFAKTYDGLGQSAFVAELYKNVLGRDIDAGEVTAAEIAGWTDLMKAGLDRAGVVNGFSESAEFKKTTLQDANSFSVNGNPAEWSDEVYRLYRATLDRDPDFVGFAAWSDILAGGRAFEQVISGFASSPEFKNAYGDLSDPAAFVTQLYSNVLDRSPDDLGLADWVDLLNSGTTREAVVRGFAQSGEFRQNTASDLKAWMRSEGVDDDIDGGAGTNVLAGGAMADKFIFRQTIASTNTVLDLEAWDYLSFEGFGYTSAADAKSHMTQVAGGVAFSDQGTDVTFQRFQLSDISDDMFLL